MSDWQRVTLAEVCKKPQYGAVASGTTEPVGPLFIRQTDINKGRIEWATVPYCDLRESDFEKYAVHPGDILVSRLGAGVGNAATVREPNDAVFAGYLVRFQPRREVAVPEFIGHLLQSEAWKAHVNGFRSGAAQPTLNAKQMGDFQFVLPSIPEQQRIAHVLQGLDDLIEHNRVLVSRLRRLALATYLRAARNGDRVTFGDVAVLVRDGASGEALIEGTRYLGLEHFAIDGGGITGSGDAASVDSVKSRFQAGDVLYGKLRPYFRKHDRPGFSGVCSTEIWVLRAAEGFGAGTLDALVSRCEFTDFAMLGSGGTRMPRADWKHVSTMPVDVPPVTARARVEASLNELWRARVALTDEIADLTRVRDELIPLLMSGRIRVRDADGLVA